LYEKGKQLVQGFIYGMKSMAGAVGGAAKSVLGGIGRLVPGSPVKEGPLRVFNKGYAGKQLMQLLASGLLDGASEVQRAMGSMPTGITATLTSLTPTGT